jgi:hypothetical protein
MSLARKTSPAIPFVFPDFRLERPARRGEVTLAAIVSPDQPDRRQDRYSPFGGWRTRRPFAGVSGDAGTLLNGIGFTPQFLRATADSAKVSNRLKVGLASKHPACLVPPQDDTPP